MIAAYRTGLEMVKWLGVLNTPSGLLQRLRRQRVHLKECIASRPAAVQTVLRRVNKAKALIVV